MIRAPRIVSSLAAPLRGIALAMLAPVVVAFLYEPLDTRLFDLVPAPSGAYPFLAAIALCAVVWLPVHLATRKLAQDEIHDREAYLSVALGWIVAALFAGLPFLIAGSLGPVDSFFEAMSGLTSTGMTALAPGSIDAFHDLANDAAHPDTAVSLLFWRATLQWLGGLAFIVLTTALLSRLTHGGLRLFGDATAGAKGRMRPKIAEVARSLGRIYVAVTITFIVLLYGVLRWHMHLVPKRAALEAIVETFAAYGNGAFTLHHFVPFQTDGWVQLILVLMMIAGATNVTLAFLLLRRRQWRALVGNPEWRFFLTLLAAAITVVGLLLYWAKSRDALALPGLDPVRDAAFHVTSVATGTGLWSYNFAYWPAGTLLVLLLVMVVGGSAGSAAGGIKAFRALTLLKLVGRELRRLVHPKAVIPVRVGRRVVAEETVSAVTAFFFTFLIAWFLGTLAIALAEPKLPLADATSASLGAMSNVGTGFGEVAPAYGVAHLSLASHAILSILMWFGRMEIFAALLVFTPQSWRN